MNFSFTRILIAFLTSNKRFNEFYDSKRPRKGTP